MEDSEGVSTPVQVHSKAEEKSPGLLRRWMQAGGGFLLFSIVVHGVLLIGAAMWVVQTVQAKRKLNFSAAPPSSSEGSRQLEYRVQSAKRTASMAPPPVSTRIVSAATDVKVALPEVALPATPNLAIPSRISGMAGNPSAFKPVASASAPPAASATPAAIPAAMPAGVTAFGFKLPPNAPVTGFRGTLYYMRRKPDGTPIPENTEKADYLARIERLFGDKGKFNEAEAKSYLPFGQQLVTPVILFPPIPGDSAPKAFGVNQVPGNQSWFAVYKAKVFAESPKRFRFVGGGNEVLLVKVDGKLVLDGCWSDLPWTNGKNPTGHRPSGNLSALWSDGRKVGDYVQFKPNGSEVEVIIGEGWGGAFGADLCIEEEGKTYEGEQRPIFKLDGYQNAKLLPQIKATLSLPESAKTLTLEGPVFKTSR